MKIKKVTRTFTVNIAFNGAYCDVSCPLLEFRSSTKGKDRCKLDYTKPISLERTLDEEDIMRSNECIVTV